MPNLLTAAEFTRLTQILTNEPLGRLATIEKTTARFHRHLVARIGKDRADAMAPLIVGGADFPTALARLKDELALMDAAPTDVDRPASIAIGDLTKDSHPIGAAKAASWPAGPRHRTSYRDLEAAAAKGRLPPPPDFSAPTHARFRTKLAAVAALAAAGDITGLSAFPINPVSSSPKALARYRDLCVAAINARKEA